MLYNNPNVSAFLSDTWVFYIEHNRSVSTRDQGIIASTSHIVEALAKLENLDFSSRRRI